MAVPSGQKWPGLQSWMVEGTVPSPQALPGGHGLQAWSAVVPPVMWPKVPAGQASVALPAGQ